MLKHVISLVFLLFSLCCMSAYSDTTDMILPKIKPKNLVKTIKKSSAFILPIKKPNLKINNKIVKKDLLPEKKPKIKKSQSLIVQNDIKKPLNNKKNIKTNEVILSSDIFLQNIDGKYLLPEKKPITFKKTVFKQAETSKVLNKKDYEYAKEIFQNIAEKKWGSVFRLTKKVSDKDFRDLITWMYLKEKNNKASFNEYKIFIEKNPIYPRLNRLKYLAEHKINLNTTSPNSVINWFNSNPPLSGFGKIKLAESYFLKGDIINGSKFLKSGWIDARLTSKDLRYLNKKYKKYLNSSDHLNRAEFMAWENK